MKRWGRVLAVVGIGVAFALWQVEQDHAAIIVAVASVFLRVDSAGE